MKNKIFVLVAFAVMLTSISSAQDFQKPSEGKAAVYFLRTSGLGAAINFKFFANDQYLGKFSGKNYAKHEFEPGKHLLYAKSENLDFIEADLKADAIYLIHVKPKMGGMKAAVRLEVLDVTDAKVLEKVKKLVAKKKPIAFNLKKAEKVTPKIKGYLEKYELKKTGEAKDAIKELSADMNYTKE